MNFSKQLLLAAVKERHAYTLRVLNMFDTPHVHFDFITGKWTSFSLNPRKRFCNLDTNTALDIINT